MLATDCIRAIEIAAAGAHSVLFIGPPSRHESRLAHRLSELMSTPTTDATCTAVSAFPRPAPRPIPLVQHPDPFPDTFERPPAGLRELGWIGLVAIPAVPGHSEYPAPFQLLAAINPCPCGYADDGTGRCHCSRHAIRRYRGRLSGPLLDRLDLHVRVRPTDLTTFLDAHHARNSNAVLRLRVAHARARQLERQGARNSALQTPDLGRFASPDRETRALLEFTAARFNLSARACERTLRVARTIADLAGTDAITVSHVSEALLFRQLDTEDDWGLSANRWPSGPGRLLPNQFVSGKERSSGASRD